MISELSEAEARSVLEAGHVGHLGCIVAEEPYVVPINYAIHGELLYLYTLPGRKLDGMRTNPRVCLQVEAVQAEHRWRSAIAFGRFEEIVAPEEAEFAFELLADRFPHLTPGDPVRRFGHGNVRPIPFRIRVERVTGVGEGA